MRIADAWGITNRGRKPGPNQDRILLGSDILEMGHVSYAGDLPLTLAAADGISADPGGEIASQAALEAVLGTAVCTTSQAMKVMEDANARIMAAARVADRKRVAAMNADPEIQGKPLPRKYMSLRNMCTTIAVVWISKKRLVWCARGDTPIYLAAEDRAVQISTPHHDPFGRLTSYLGADARVTMQSTNLAVIDTAGVRAVAIMSDGVSNFVPEDILLGALVDETRSVAEIGKDLMHRASANDSYDNLSFVMARIEPA